MFKLIAAEITSRTDHPYIISLFLFAACFIVGALAAEFVFNNGLTAAFLAVYGGMAAILGILGYGVIYLLRVASMFRNRTMPWKTDSAGR